MDRGPKQKQMGVSLPDDLRKMLEDACARADRSLAEEIRVRLYRTFDLEEIDPSVRSFMAETGLLAMFTGRQTGQDWRTHPAANAVLRHALNAWLTRTKENGPETFASGELPSSMLVCSDDPQTIGVGIEAILKLKLEDCDGDAECLSRLEARNAKKRK
jgi:hypothetical protein